MSTSVDASSTSSGAQESMTVSHPRDGCTYWSFFRSQLVNGHYTELAKRFRQCPGQPKEIAVLNPATHQTEWQPAKAADENDLPALSAVGAATDLIHEVLPEFDRVNRHLQEDPLIGRFVKGWLPPPRDSTTDLARLKDSSASFTGGHPIENIEQSFATFGHKLDRLVRGPSTSTNVNETSAATVARIPTSAFSSPSPTSGASKSDSSIEAPASAFDVAPSRTSNNLHSHHSDGTWFYLWLASFAIGEDFMLLPT